MSRPTPEQVAVRLPDGMPERVKLAILADDAFTVLNWARRLGFDRERQLAEVVKTFEIRLGYRKLVAPADEVAS